MKSGVFEVLEQDRVRFGVAAADGIAAEVAMRGAQRLFVVTSRSLNRKTSAVADAVAPVKERVVGLFDEWIEHTPRDTTVVRWNAQACASSLAEVAGALGDARRPAADQVEALIAALGLPTRIGQLGIARERLAFIAEKGLANPSVRSNPRKIERVEQLVEILEAAW